ncbi:MAG TPA: NUDIX hydrolase [Acidimicrobiaceae bacterium]|nr:NUDIX hydrolase [Acidimicrobiaceae bacterium]
MGPTQQPWGRWTGSGHRTVSSAESSRGIYFVTNTDDWYAFTNPEDAFDDRLSTAVAAVEAFTPTDQAQRAAQDTILEFVEQNPDALHRSCLDGHFTGSSWVVDHDASSGLILLHTKAKRWLQPGGHADGNARLEAVALREAQEESGIENLEVWSRPIDIDVHVVEDPSASQSSHLHLDVRYLIKAPKGARVQGNHESLALQWITEDQLDDQGLALDDSTKRVARYGFRLAEQLLT